MIGRDDIERIMEDNKKWKAKLGPEASEAVDRMTSLMQELQMPVINFLLYMKEKDKKLAETMLEGSIVATLGTFYKSTDEVIIRLDSMRKMVIEMDKVINEVKK